MYDLIIVGGGPAGVAAAVYAARKQLQTLFITTEWGGQSVVSADIQNWIGTPHLSGTDLAKNLRTHVEQYAGNFLTIKNATASSLQVFDDHIEVTCGSEACSARSLLVCSGAKRRRLEIPGSDAHENKGLTYCASCDGPLFAGQDVAIVGGGNAAFESALQLLAYCKTVTLLNRSSTLRADEITVAAARAHANMRIVMNAEPVAVEGDKFVTGIRYKDAAANQEILLPVTGIFVEIGLLPNTAWVDAVVAKNQIGQIQVDPKTQRASHPRIWAAGDCTDGLYHQNNIAAGDAVKALEDIYLALKKK